jgi:hypothetical protein
VVELVSREPASEPAEDCELALRGITGLRLDAAVEATIFRVGVAPFSPFPPDGGGGGGGRISVCGGVAVAAFSRLTDDGNGGGGICDGTFGVGVPGAIANSSSTCVSGIDGGKMSEDTAVLPEDTSSSLTSSSEPAGDTKRAVGRGPEAEGPLDFFRIGCRGGGLEEEGVGDFAFDLDELDSCP